MSEATDIFEQMRQKIWSSKPGNVLPKYFEMNESTYEVLYNQTYSPTIGAEFMGVEIRINKEVPTGIVTVKED